MTTTNQSRPQRKGKADRLIYSGVPKAEMECDYAVAPLDRLAARMDEKWGVDRLPELVSVETARKYGSAMAKLNAAIEAHDPEETNLRAQVCMRGLAAMDREATEAGQPTASADYWECEVEGFRFAVMKDAGHWKACQAERPDLRFFSLREIGIALKALKIDGPMFAEVKKHFPTAEITRVAKQAATPVDFETGGDPIPF